MDEPKDNWRDISTCPERVRVLLWNGVKIQIGRKSVDVGEDVDEEVQFINEEGETIEPRLYGHGEPVPTKWHPLPLPPVK